MLACPVPYSQYLCELNDICRAVISVGSEDRLWLICWHWFSDYWLTVTVIQFLWHSTDWLYGLWLFSVFWGTPVIVLLLSFIIMFIFGSACWSCIDLAGWRPLMLIIISCHISNCPAAGWTDWSNTWGSFLHTLRCATLRAIAMTRYATRSAKRIVGGK